MVPFGIFRTCCRHSGRRKSTSLPSELGSPGTQSIHEHERITNVVLKNENENWMTMIGDDTIVYRYGMAPSDAVDSLQPEQMPTQANLTLI